jgi:hypothetical protein
MNLIYDGFVDSFPSKFNTQLSSYISSTQINPICRGSQGSVRCVHGFRQRNSMKTKFFAFAPQTATFTWLQLARCSSVCCANQLETSKRV